MDFTFTEEQTQIRDALRRFLSETYTLERRRRIARAGSGCDPEIWAQFAERGILGLLIPQPLGGIGGNAFDALVVMEELGRALVIEPYLATALVGAGILVRAGSPAQQELLAGVAAGKTRLALAHDEPDSRWQLEAIATRATREGAGWTLKGRKAMVVDGAGADYLMVSARTESGLSLFLVPGPTERLTRAALGTHDGSSVAEIALDGVRVPADALIGSEGGALALVEAAREVAIAGLCSEAVGAMDALLALTLAYVKTRKQFGVPIGGFQALQHRMADMLLHAELARSMSYLATAKLAVPDAGERRRALSAAKFLIGRSARLVGQEAVQMHGGMGVTDELATSHYFKRLTLINASCGDRDHHLDEFAAGMITSFPQALLSRSAANASAPRSSG
ncbi:MAG TPA: acyl-CoA dehydrogenase family protein [Steroidobacteraceae bacterium]|nr:acyl-CoA dehydrogenase family protein [Steroidobacteraceae bacterium]